MENILFFFNRNMAKYQLKLEKTGSLYLIQCSLWFYGDYRVLEMDQFSEVKHSARDVICRVWDDLKHLGGAVLNLLHGSRPAPMVYVVSFDLVLPLIWTVGSPVMMYM